jgi:RNA polymerase sigma-70 factor, ECF subfamily
VADTAVGLHVDGCLFSHAEEDALVSALGQGAEDAYEILIQRYQQPVYSLVCRLMNDPSDAPDIVQEVFLKVFRSIGGFRGNSSLKTWIYRIAVNEAYNHRRWFCRHQRQEVAIGSEEGAPHHADTMTDPGRSPFEQAADHETRALVEQALEGLNPKFRAAVVLRDSSKCIARHREVAHHARPRGIAEESGGPARARPAGTGGRRTLVLRTGD